MTATGSRRLLIDDRLPADGGTGVATYGGAVRAAARAAGWRPHDLRATAAAGGGAARVARWLRAAMPGAIRLEETAAGDLVARDPFRLAQVRFRRGGGLTWLAAPGPPGIVHWTYPVPLAVRGWTNLYTVHDVIPLTHPELTPIPARRHRRLLRTILPVADRIVTVSAASRATILTALGCDPDLVVDCGQAAMLPARPDALPAGLVPDGYLLACGLIEPRKNLSRLIAAWGVADTGLPLVLAGPDGWRAAPIAAEARAAGVRLLGYQPRATLAALVAGARALVLPSLAEGFGLPLVEAMALGTPALVSRDPALCEVAGGAALSVDACDVAALAAGLRAIASDDPLRTRLIARGRERAAAFTVEAFGRRLAALYDAVAPPPRSANPAHPPQSTEPA